MPPKVVTRATHAKVIDSFLNTLNAEKEQEIRFVSGVALAWCQSEAGGMVQVRMNRDDAVQLSDDAIQLSENVKKASLPFKSFTPFPDLDTGETQLSVFIEEKNMRVAWLTWFIEALRGAGHIDRDEELRAYISFELPYSG